jgi:anaerobic ribonucleoside-triphosphate reductase
MKNEYFNSFGSGGTKIGSLGVVTINLPRISFQNKGNEEAFKIRLRHLVEMSFKINYSKRKILTEFQTKSAIHYTDNIQFRLLKTKNNLKRGLARYLTKSLSIK